MGPVEVPEERRVHHELPGDPAAFLAAILLPVSQVLEPPTPAAHPQPPNRPLEMSIDQLRRWRSRGSGHERARGDRFEHGDVKNQVDPQGGGELKTHRHRVQDVVNHEGPDIARCQLPGGDLERKVSRGEVDPLTRPVYRSRGAAVIGPTAGALAGAEQGGADLPPNPATPAEMGLDRGDGDLRLLERKQRGLVSQGGLERGPAGGSAGQGVEGVFDPGQVRAPGEVEERTGGTVWAGAEGTLAAVSNLL